jgi:CLIP-associating protein 1/2
LQRAHLANQPQAPTDPLAGVQVYEDPFIQDEPVSRPVGPVKPVLEEIAINERTSDAEREAPLNTLSQSTRSNEQNIEAQRNQPTPVATPAPGPAKPLNGSAPAADQAQAGAGAGETLRNRRLLTSAIERVRAKTLDAHGFRRVQEIVKAPAQDIWGADGARFADLLLALLDYLETPAEGLRALTAAGAAAATGGPGAGKAVNLKTQVLATVRAMLALHRRAAAPHYPRAMCAVLRARGRFDDVSHLATEAERACEDMARAAPSPGACVDAVLDLVEGLVAPAGGDATTTTGAPRTVKAALAALAALLEAAAAREKGGQAATAGQARRLGAVAVRLLQDADAEVRRADLEFCLVLHERLGGDGDEGFWRVVDGAKESGRNLITYYLARRGRARA